MAQQMDAGVVADGTEPDQKMNGTAAGETDATDNNGINGNDNETLLQRQGIDLSGMKTREFGEAELMKLHEPLIKGWRRELVIRGTSGAASKKSADVYYYSPDTKDKLRSYVDLGHYLRKYPNSGLGPGNFTFAKQPIYKAPEEIVRNAMPRGSNEPSEALQSSPLSSPTKKAAPVAIGQGNGQSPNKATPVKPDPAKLAAPESPALSGTLAEGRVRRKSKAPARFEDLDLDTPFKKKPKVAKSAEAKDGAPGAKTTEEKRRARVVFTNPTKRNSTQGQTSLLKQPNAPAKIGQQQAPIENSEMKPAGETASANSEPQVKEETMANNDEVPSTEEIHTTVVLSVNTEAGDDGPAILTISDSAENQISSTAAVNGEQTTAESESKEPQLTSSTQQADQSASQQVQPPRLQKSTQGFKPIRPRISAPGDRLIVNVKAPSSQPRIIAADIVNLGETSFNGDQVDMGGAGDGSAVPPCGITCPGRQGTLPNSLCNRCLCLFHPECVPGAVYKNGEFICPNCKHLDDTPPPSIRNSLDLSTAEAELRQLVDPITAQSQAGSSNGRVQQYRPILPKAPHQLQKSKKLNAVLMHRNQQRQQQQLKQPQKIVQRSGHLQLSDASLLEFKKQSLNFARLASDHVNSAPQRSRPESSNGGITSDSAATLIDRMFAHLAKETEVMREWVQLERERLSQESIRRREDQEREERREKVFLDAIVQLQSQMLNYLDGGNRDENENETAIEGNEGDIDGEIEGEEMEEDNPLLDGEQANAAEQDLEEGVMIEAAE